MSGRKRRESNDRKKVVGQIRRGQIVTTYGPGSLIDLPRQSAMIAGLEYWSKGEIVNEPRLRAKAALILGIDSLELRAPIAHETFQETVPKGIVAWQFPEWFITRETTDESRSGTRSRVLVKRTLLENNKYKDEERKLHDVIPIRFVRGCRNGHIGDIDWRAYVHKDKPRCYETLRLVETGTSGDLSEIMVSCDCGARRPILDATRFSSGALGKCDGSLLWLGADERDSECTEMNRLLVRTASNAYFPQTLRVISIPERDAELVKSVDRLWEHDLKFVEELEDLIRDRKRKPHVAEELARHNDDDVMREIQARRSTNPSGSAKSIKEIEFETLISSPTEIGLDAPDGDFFARSLDRSVWEKQEYPWMNAIESVILIHRLREVTAQFGFTRFEASTTDIDGELDIGAARAPLSKESNWIPAVENRGEGIFIRFRSESIADWINREEVKERGSVLFEGFQLWLEEHPTSGREFFGLPYLMLHSFSHLLLTTISLECGYPASSLRERVYAGEYGFGVMIYTASPDSEGTLGGLVESGRGIARFIKDAIYLGALCSNDPVCSQHDPSFESSRRLQGAACHGCLLISETSCEQFNDFLDRALVVETVDDYGCEFFQSSHRVG